MLWPVVSTACAWHGNLLKHLKRREILGTTYAIFFAAKVLGYQVQAIPNKLENYFKKIFVKKKM